MFKPLKATLSGTGESVLSCAATPELLGDRKSPAFANHCHHQHQNTDSIPVSSPLSGREQLKNGAEDNVTSSGAAVHETEEEGGEDEVMSMFQMRNFFDWIRRPYLIAPEYATSNVQLARTIDHVSKTVFTLLFGLFCFFYFLTYAFIKVSANNRIVERGIIFELLYRYYEPKRLQKCLNSSFDFYFYF